MKIFRFRGVLGKVVAPLRRRKRYREEQENRPRGGFQYEERRFETAAQRVVGAFLEPFRLTELFDAVHQLTGAGYTTEQVLAVLDEETLVKIGLCATDVQRVLRATWLQRVGLEKYGPQLLDAGCDSPLKLVDLTEDQLSALGMKSIGPRRQLLRYVKNDATLQAKAARAREEAEEAAKGKKGRRRKGGRQKGLYAVRETGKDGATLRGLGNNALRLGALQQSAPLPSANVPDIYARQDTWDEQWRTMSNASLLGVAPGGRAERHYDARTPREFRIVMNDGSEMML